MRSGQRIIKYLAIALAIFIIVSIVSSILLSFNIFSDFLGLTKENRPENSMIETQNQSITSQNFNSNEIANMKLELAYSSLTIKEGDNFKVETNTNRIESKKIGNQLVIKEKGTNIFLGDSKRFLTVTVPKDIILDTVKIEAGAGEIKIEKLATENLNLEIGAGKATIQNLQVTEKAKVEGGAGKMEIKAGNIANLDLDMGVGSFTLNTSLEGNNKIDAGIGKLELNLTNGLQNYTIRAEKGIGSITIDNKEVSNNVEYGNGATNIKINGGVGNIEVK